MASTKWKEISKGVRSDPERRVRLAEQKRALEDAIGIAQVREMRHMTQVDVAKALGQSQSRVSRIERQPDLYVSTLAEYVEALGGRLELVAVFEDEEDGRVELSVGAVAAPA